jgi:uncharacterized membrane protein YqjE
MANAAGVVLAGVVYFAVPGDRWALVATLIALGGTVLATLACLWRMQGCAAPAVASLRSP